MNGALVDRIFKRRIECVTSHLFPTLRRPHAYQHARISRRLPGTKECSWSPSGLSSTSLANGARTSTDGSKLSSISFPTGRTETTSTVNFPHQVTPHIGDLSVQVRQAILARIRRCGRIGDEREARWLYIVHGVGFRQYRSAYETGRQEARRVRTEQEGRA